MKDILRKIREVATPLLHDGVVIQDIVFRPFDMGVFGGNGYTLVLVKPSNRKMYGCVFPEEPTEDRIKCSVEQAQNIIERDA